MKHDQQPYGGGASANQPAVSLHPPAVSPNPPAVSPHPPAVSMEAAWSPRNNGFHGVHGIQFIIMLPMESMKSISEFLFFLISNKLRDMLMLGANKKQLITEQLEALRQK